MKLAIFITVLGSVSAMSDIRPDYDTTVDPLYASSEGRIIVTSQMGNSSHVEIHHNIGHVPIFVEVLCQVLDGENNGFVFPAMGSQQADDNLDAMYGGVLFTYDEIKVNVYVPTETATGLYHPRGKAINTGAPAWSHGYSYNASETKIRVRAWKASSLPDVAFNNTVTLTSNQDCKTDKPGRGYRGEVSNTISGRTCQRWDSQIPHFHTRTDTNYFPEDVLADASNYCRNPDSEPDGPWCYTVDVNTRWEYCNVSLCGPDSYKEIVHGLNTYPMLITVNIQVDCNGSLVYFNGIGSAQTNGLGHYEAYGGILYAYNKTAVRLWAPTGNKGAAASIHDGWANTPFICDRVQVTVLMWTDVGEEVYSSSLILGGSLAGTTVNPDTLTFYTGHQVEPLLQVNSTYVVTVAVEALDGDNRGYRFHGMGAGQSSGRMTSQLNNDNYGGVVYGYDDVMIRVWRPLHPHGYLVMVESGWGSGQHKQISNHVKLVVRVSRMLQKQAIATTTTYPYKATSIGTTNISTHVDSSHSASHINITGTAVSTDTDFATTEADIITPGPDIIINSTLTSFSTTETLHTGETLIEKSARVDAILEKLILNKTTRQEPASEAAGAAVIGSGVLIFPISVVIFIVVLDLVSIKTYLQPVYENCIALKRFFSRYM